MSVVFEPRSYSIHDGPYAPLEADGDEADLNATAADDVAVDRYPESDVVALANDYNAQSLLGDISTEDEPGSAIVASAATAAAALHLPSPPEIQTAVISDVLPGSATKSIPGPVTTATTGTTTAGNRKDSPEAPSTPSARIKAIPKPDREVTKQADGKFYCNFPKCTEETRVFGRKCEWSKHMDKHERPYRCTVEGCEKLPGFTYSGGLLRHEREVHNKHGGPKNTVNCPYANCKRHAGKGFSRQENLNEHLRRVHTNEGGILPAKGAISMTAGSPPAESIRDETIVATAGSPTSDDGSEKATPSAKRKRSRTDSADDLSELRDEIKRVRQENQKLHEELVRNSKATQAMVTQISELQEALRLNNMNSMASAAVAASTTMAATTSGAPTAPMV